MNARTITGTLKAQLSSCFGPEELKLEDQRVLNLLNFSNHDMTEYGTTVVGIATVTVTLHSTDEILVNKVEALRGEAKNVQAEATAKVTRINRQINELLALTNEVKS